MNEVQVQVQVVGAGAGASSTLELEAADDGSKVGTMQSARHLSALNMWGLSYMFICE